MTTLLRRVRARAGRPADAGMTLAELLATMVLSGIVLAVVGTFLVRSLVIQQGVRDQTRASTSGQVVLDDLQATLRNAVSVTVPSAFDGSLLLVKTRVGDNDADAASFVCRGWYLDAGSGVLRTVSGAPGTAAPTRGLSPSSSFASWRVQVEDVRPSTSGGATLPVFAAEGSTGAQVRFEVVDGRDGSSTTITSAAVPRPQGPSTGAATCF